MPDLDSYLVRHALTVARENGYAEVEISADGASFSAVLEPRKTAPKAATAVVSTEPEVLYLKSSLVGYLQSISIAPGDDVKKGVRVAIVSALGLANDIESQVTGTVLELLVKPGDPVEFGQPIAAVAPA